MRFWQRIFLATLAIILAVVMGVCTALLLMTSKIEWENEKLRGMQEQRLLSSVIHTRVEQQAFTYFSEERQSEAMSPREACISGNVDSQTTDEEAWLIAAVSESENLNRDEDVYFEIYNLSGKCMYSNVPFAFGGVRLDLEQAMNGNTFSLIKKINEEEVVQYVTGPFSGSLHDYILVLVRDLSALQHIRNRQANLIALVGCIAAVLASVVMLVMVRLTTRSIQHLRTMTSRIAHGDYGKTIPITSNDEMGELASDFNLMSLAIADHMEELKEEADGKEHFIRNLTHEFKTPLTSIIGFADLMRRMKLTEDQVMEFADHIYNQGTHLKEISSRLMEWIFLKNNTIQLHTDNLTALCRLIVTEEQPIFDQKGVLLVYKLHEAYVPMDKTLLRTMITNLMDNALKAVEEETGVVQLETGTTKQGEVFLCVSDNGKGIPKDKLKYVMEPFFMVDKARTRASHGAGLGLSLCQEIARLHHARITIDSKEGTGTFVMVRWRRGAE